MAPDINDLDDEIKGHLALEIRERIERGEDPAAARLAALRQFGYVPQMRDAMRRVWQSPWLDMAQSLAQDMRVGLRSLLRAKGLAATVVITLALGIGANAAIFSVVRGVLLRPLANRDEARLIYIRQTGPGVGDRNMTFSVPEIADLKARVTTTVSAFGDFSTVEFPMVGFGEPRIVRAGVVSGSFFEVMGLRPVLGRLLDGGDDGLKAAGAAVLTHRFWTESLNSDPSVIGRTIGLGPRTAVVVGVLEPSVPYPADTEIIANVVTSPHHLGATMITSRTHRMTELFGRLASGVTLEQARAELAAAHAAIVREHPEAYSSKAEVQLTATPLRDQITAPARTILLLLLASAGVVFVIACSNVANLILARTVRREGELTVRAALGASRAALRRTLLAESLVLCGAGAILGVAIARPLVAIVADYAARYTVRALDVTIDGTILWIGAGLAIVAAVLLAYVPRLPPHHAKTTWWGPRQPLAHVPGGPGLGTSGVRMTPATNRRLRAFATAQIALSFVLLAGAGMLVAALIAMQSAGSDFDTRVLAFDVPAPVGDMSDTSIDFYREVTRRIGELAGVNAVAVGSFVPWRDAGRFGSMPFAVEGYTPADGEDDPRARIRIVSPGFFPVFGVPLLAGRNFTDDDRRGSELVVMVSQSLAQRLFPDGEAVNRRMWWTDPMFGRRPHRIIGVVPDLDDENVVAGSAVTVYHTYQQMGVGGRVFVRTSGEPYAFVPSVRRIIREVSPNQPVERAATLEDVRAEVLAPDRLNAFVISGFAAVALLIAVVGVAGVLAFSVSARVREFGVRLAIGSSPRSLLIGVLAEGAMIVAIGIAAGAAFGYSFAGVAASYLANFEMPGMLPVLGAAVVLGVAAVLASLMPAARASRVDVLQALRPE